jgi:hypothetical protein
MRTFKVSAVVTALSAALVLGGVTSASASADTASPTVGGSVMPAERGTPSDPKVIAIMKAQKPLDDAADRVRKLAKDTATDGLGAVTINSSDNSITVSWRGAIPADVQAELTADRRHGITVHTKAAAYTGTQLYAEMARLAKTVMPAGTKPTAVDSIAVNGAGNGLVIGVRPTAAAALSPHRALTAADVPGLSSSMPLTVISQQPVKTADGSVYPSRQSGYNWTGAGQGLHTQWANGSWHGCTTGFAVQSPDQTKSYIETAAHCGWGNFDTFTSANSDYGTFIGRTTAITYSNDVQIIPATSLQYEWDGTSMTDTLGAAWNNPPGGQFYKYITGDHSNNGGDDLCVSGSFSGAQCFAQVQGSWMVTKQLLDADGQYRDAQLWYSYSTSGKDLIGEGDSGGPVFSSDPLDGWNSVDAAGLVTAFDGGDSNCQGVPSSYDLYDWQGTRQCSQSMYFSDNDQAMNALQVALKYNNP